MIEFVMVDHPTKFPQACVACMSQKGPMLDTHAERFGSHVYVCQACLDKGAVLSGRVKGERARELSALAQGDAEKDKLIEELSGLLKTTREELADVSNLAIEQDARLGLANGRIAQLEARIRETAEAELALVGKPLDVDAQPRDIITRTL